MAGGHTRERTALIATVLNEAGSIPGLLASLADQTVPPDEVVIVDGGSRDDTWAVLESWTSRLPLRLISAPGSNISAGRNQAIASTTCEHIAVTDAGVRLERRWLEHLQADLRDDVDVVSGFFRPDSATTFEVAMGATVLPDVDDITPSGFLPSSRSILLRRAVWEQVGGYPEWLDYCEDLVFDLALRRAGARFAFAPRAVAWFRPRGSLGSFYRQYYLYARGDGKADLWRRRHAIRYATYVAGCALVMRMLTARSGRGRVVPLLALAAGAIAYTARPYARLWPHLATRSADERARALAVVPLVRLVGDVAKMLGYPVGVLWRLKMTWTSRSSS